MVRASSGHRRAKVVRGAQRAAREESSRHRRASACESADVCSGGRGDRAHVRWLVQRSVVPVHGEVWHAVRTQHAARRHVPGHRQPDEPEPAHGESGALHADEVRRRAIPERARCRVDSVSGPRLVRSQEGIVGQHPQHSRCGRRHLARASDARADHARRSSARGLDETAGVHQRELTLVGWIPGVRLDGGGAGCHPHGTGRQDQGRPRWPAADRSRHGSRAHRHDRQRLGGIEPDARSLRARAQRGLRSIQAAQPGMDRRAPLPAGASRRLRAHRQDSHRRVVNLDYPEPPGVHRGARQLGRPPRRCAEHLSRSQRQRSARRRSRIADRSSHRAVLADRGVRVRLSHAPADAGRLHAALGGDQR